MDKNSEVLVLDLKKIKDITQLSFRPKYVLIEAISTKKSGILDQNGFNMDAESYWEVLKVGSAVTEVKVGDIVLDFNIKQANFIAKDEHKYLVINDYDLVFWTDRENYNFK